LLDPLVHQLVSLPFKFGADQHPLLGFVGDEMSLYARRQRCLDFGLGASDGKGKIIHSRGDTAVAPRHAPHCID
jgi:hypothetical protein